MLGKESNKIYALNLQLTTVLNIYIVHILNRYCQYRIWNLLRRNKAYVRGCATENILIFIQVGIMTRSCLFQGHAIALGILLL